MLFNKNKTLTCQRVSFSRATYRFFQHFPLLEGTATNI